MDWRTEWHLAVCSCTVLRLFAGIWRMGAGLGPATAFLYSGPAITALGTAKTVVYVSLVSVMSTVTGMAFGAVAGCLRPGLRPG